MKLEDVGCRYDEIRDISKEKDVQLSFMHLHGPVTSYHWPEKEDICYVPLQCVLCLVDAPNTTNG